MQDRADPHARERALAVASQDPPSGVAPDEAVAEVRVRPSNSPKKWRAAYRAHTVGSEGAFRNR
jgi:hypothetical protein